MHVQGTQLLEVPSEVVTGYGQCITAGCDGYGVLEEFPLVVETMAQKAVGLPVIVTQTEHHHPQEQADGYCPVCGEPRAVMRTPPPNYRPWR